MTRAERPFVTRCDGCARRRATVAAFRMLHGTPFFCRQCWQRLARAHGRAEYAFCEWARKRGVQ